MITTVPVGGALGLTPVLGEAGHDAVIAVTLHIPRSGPGTALALRSTSAIPPAAAPPTQLDRLTKRALPLQVMAARDDGKDTGPARVSAAQAAQLPGGE